MINYFPTTLARGEAFCNRKEELQRIMHDLKNGTPILLVSPRRYGKTSLALQAFEKAKVTYAHVDLYKALSEEDIEKYILNAIGELLGKMESIPQKLIHLAGDFFSELQVNVSIGKAGLQLSFNRKRETAGEIILKSLEKLDGFASRKKHRVVLFLDEFQVVGEVAHHGAIEAALREAVQKSTHVEYVFSGSNRHLMEQMFYDKKRPFYQLCDNVRINKIKSEEYENYIQHAAKKTWKSNLTSEVLTTIIELTECHPYYINKLCSILWMQPSVFNKNTVLEAWNHFVIENKSVTERELSLLSINQRKVLIFLSREGGIKEITGKDASNRLSLAPSSVQRAVSLLIEKDYIFMDDMGAYQVLDPLIKAVLAR